MKSPEEFLKDEQFPNMGDSTRKAFAHLMRKYAIGLAIEVKNECANVSDPENKEKILSVDIANFFI